MPACASSIANYGANTSISCGIEIDLQHGEGPGERRFSSSKAGTHSSRAPHFAAGIDLASITSIDQFRQDLDTARDVGAGLWPAEAHAHRGRRF